MYCSSTIVWLCDINGKTLNAVQLHVHSSAASQASNRQSLLLTIRDCYCCEPHQV